MNFGREDPLITPRQSHKYFASVCQDCSRRRAKIFALANLSLVGSSLNIVANYKHSLVYETVLYRLPQRKWMRRATEGWQQRHAWKDNAFFEYHKLAKPRCAHKRVSESVSRLNLQWQRRRPNGPKSC